MTSILFVIVRIYGNQLKFNYLKTKNFFPNFLLYFWKVHDILNILKQNVTLIAYVFPKLWTAKHVVG